MASLETRIKAALSAIATQINALTAAPFTANVGNGSATSFTLTHGYGTRDVIVQVYRNSAPYDQVRPDINRDTTGNVILGFKTAPSSNQYRAVISRR